jgi:hypothetical protein
VRPTVGRIVHYVSMDGHHYAAIVVEVGASSINLTVFSDTPGQVLGIRTTTQDEDDKKAGTWHWPEREAV